MQNYVVRLTSPVSTTFKATKAANSLDIDVNKKSIHELNISADIESPFNIGLILGASGSGKTTLAKKIFGENCFDSNLIMDLPIIDQFPEEFSYEECVNLLTGIGLTSVPCWIRPVYTLSNGQKTRAEAALLISNKEKEIIILDEWTSVVDRTVAKVMSICINKFAKKYNKKIILLSCHYDVVEWLDPDFIIDCNKQQYTDRRLLSKNERQRTEKLNFQIREIDKSSWKYFNKYHYLSENIPGGFNKFFGLFEGENQIGFQMFSNYVPHRNKLEKKIMHSNRTVIHPDYVGLGLGVILINETSKIMSKNYKIMAKFSSTPVYKAFLKHTDKWLLKEISKNYGKTNVSGNMKRKSGFRENIKTYSFEYIGDSSNE